MLPFIFNSADVYEEEEEHEEEEVVAVAAAAAVLCIIASCFVFVSIQQKRLRGSQKDCGRRGDDDSGEEDDFMSTTETSTSDDGFSLDDDDDDDDDEPPPGEKRAAPVTTKKTTQSFETSESSLDVEIANDPLPLLKKAPPPVVKSDDEDSGDDLIRAAPAKGKSKAVQAGKRKSLDDENDDSDAYIRAVKKTKTAAQTRMTVSESFEKSLARAKLASKTTTVRKSSGSTKLPPKKVHAKAMETSDDE